jgi:hypothetical protein
MNVKSKWGEIHITYLNLRSTNAILHHSIATSSAATVRAGSKGEQKIPVVSFIDLGLKLSRVAQEFEDAKPSIESVILEHPTPFIGEGSPIFFW